MRTLPCGCHHDGSWFCDEHEPSRQAADPIALVALSLAIGAVLVWAAILG